MPSINRNQFTRDGFIIIDMLEPAEVATFLAATEEMLVRLGSPNKTAMTGFGLLAPRSSDPTLQTMVHHPALMSAIEQLIGGPVILDNAKVLTGDPGVSYRQGWHRDTLQIPESEIPDEMFSPRWRHNSVQINLALTEDRAFWAVPGSHSRPNTPAEWKVFGGSKHYSPEGVDMPGGRCIVVKPGQAALYNNNLIHRGTAELTSPRRTFHMGFHCALYPPTWHFYVFNDDAVTPDFLATLTPPVRRMVEARAARRKLFPDVRTSYRAGLEKV